MFVRMCANACCYVNVCLVLFVTRRMNAKKRLRAPRVATRVKRLQVALMERMRSRFVLPSPTLSSPYDYELLPFLIYILYTNTNTAQYTQTYLSYSWNFL
ncbi:hypothetical protein CHUAL_005159 [Chamberlinius hualienensis]